MSLSRNIHHTIGPIIVLFVLLLSITGIMLNHSSDLELDNRYLTWNWLLKHYNIANVEPDAVYLLGHRTISQFGTEIFVDAKPVAHIERALLGGIMLDDLMVLATDDALVLLNHDGEFIERMGATAGVPPNIQNIGLFHGEPIVQTRDGLWRSDFLLDQWERISLQGVGWSVPLNMPESVEAELAIYFHGKGITVERFILDLHNGRIIKVAGTYLLDLIGILLIILSLTGLWIWIRRRW
ncbi:MAG: PepSY domain-containing protein [Methylophaga sp.]|nr:PepSY domain-containing protein [Methylophaga sp.]